MVTLYSLVGLSELLENWASSGIGSYPQLYLAWMICRIPVLGPNIPRYAVIMQHTKLKNRIIRAASRSPRPKLKVPAMPVTILKAYYYWCSRM